MTGTPQKILAVTLGGLGDAILFSPVLTALHRQYPAARIRLLAASRLAASAYRPAAAVTVVHTGRAWFPFKVAALLPFALRARLGGGYDLGVYAVGLNPAIAANLGRLGAIRKNVQIPRLDNKESDLACNVRLAKLFDPTASEHDAFLPIDQAAREEARRVCADHGIPDSARLLAVYLSKEFHHRPRWPIENLMKTVALLQGDRNEFVAVAVGSPQEARAWDRSAGTVVHNLAGTLSISGLGALLSRCSLAICNDGGIMHVAGVCGCPTVAVMPTTPATYRPAGNVVVVGSGRACHPNRPETCSKPDCLDQITPQQVAGACRNLLDR